jgi:hypothetical protein
MQAGRDNNCLLYTSKLATLPLALSIQTDLGKDLKNIRKAVGMGKGNSDQSVNQSLFSLLFGIIDGWERKVNINILTLSCPLFN